LVPDRRIDMAEKQLRGELGDPNRLPQVEGALPPAQPFGVLGAAVQMAGGFPVLSAPFQGEDWQQSKRLAPYRSKQAKSG